MKSKKVVVTGVGVATSISNEYSDVMEFMKNSDVYKKVDDTNIQITVSNTFGKNDCRRMDEFALYSLMAAYNAITDSQLNIEVEDKSRIGTVYTTTWGPVNTTYKYFTSVLKDGTKGVSPLLFPYTVTNAAVGAVARFFKLSGVSTMLVDSFSIDFAYRQILDDKADVMLCGASECLQKLLKEFEFDQKIKIPFDGSVVMILETEDHALLRGAKIYAEIIGGEIRFSNNDEETAGFFAHNIEKLLEKANINEECSIVFSDYVDMNKFIESNKKFQDYLSLELPFNKQLELLSLQQMLFLCYVLIYSNDSNPIILNSKIGNNNLNTLLVVKKYE